MLALLRSVRSRPRLIVALLLALAIELLRPTVRPVSHQHPGGDRPHIHVGDVIEFLPADVSAAASRPPEAEAADGPGLRAAPVGGLHFHVIETMHHTGLPAPVAPRPQLIAGGVPPAAPVAVPRALRLASQARSPPAPRS